MKIDLPKLKNDMVILGKGTLIVDDNHGDDHNFYRENIAVQNLLKKTKIHDVIFLTARKTLRHRTFMLSVLKNHGANIHIIPSQWKAVTLYMKKHGTQKQ